MLRNQLYMPRWHAKEWQPICKRLGFLDWGCLKGFRVWEKEARSGDGDNFTRQWLSEYEDANV